MKDATREVSAARHLEILDYWHKIEFFIPFDLQQVVEDEDDDRNIRQFNATQVAALSPAALWSVPVPDGRKLSGFDVYLGVFDKSELAEVTLRLIDEPVSPSQALDEQERGELEGLTCAASIRVGPDGIPRLDDLAVSTVPWTLGRIARVGLGGLDFAAFKADMGWLKREVKTFRATLQHLPGERPKAMTAQELLTLLQIVATWSGHAQESSIGRTPAVVIRTRTVEEKPAKAPLQADDDAAERDDESGSDAPDEPEISILNSFFADDLARAMASVEQGKAGRALRDYLSPVAASAKVDLYQTPGRRLIAERLSPAHLNAGRWPDTPAHAMSLMQQFAINSMFEQLSHDGLFSVNGPPGTGKTTLLRDVFATNVVHRARALNRCTKATDAFLPERVKVSFQGERDCEVSVLRDELVGFEMVVASSNNAAVENISKDLPRNKSLGKPQAPDKPGWRDIAGQPMVSYLQPVARNLAERTRRGSYELPDTSDDDLWGLVACALGNQRNRNAFVSALSSAGPKRGEKPPKGFDPTRHQSLWQWRSRYAGCSFAEARRAFAAADQSFQETASKLETYATLRRKWAGVTEASFVAGAVVAVSAAIREHGDAKERVADLDDQWASTGRQLELLRAEEALIEKRRPGWWTRLCNRQARRAHEEALATNQREQARLLRHRHGLEDERTSARRLLTQTRSAMARADAALAESQKTWAEAHRQQGALAKEFPDAHQPQDLDELESDRWQIKGLWYSETLNARRSALFVSALQLHEAWLAEVMQQGAGFAQNIIALCHLLEGKRLGSPDQALALWRSLFMIVPVVSSTFASFARQFRHLGPEALGWLFIDEAGQAVPQAAVGALWRAQRAVVVGDPLQIQPVFTVPIKLLEALEKTNRLPADMTVSPYQASAQTLADEAHALGAHVAGQQGSQWIGCPLRVHRRCVDPMFSIANEIAYDHKMIFFDPHDPAARQPPGASLDIGPSAWVQAPGEAVHKQVVARQVELVHQAVATLYARTGKLPPLYIISPFKRIKQALMQTLKNRDGWILPHTSGRAPKAEELRNWCRQHIGTVHTFQGKEESIVWLVLGCDERTAGSARWAASTPNLLNVALTRAKHRCMVIGDDALWGGLRHFVSAHEGRLPRVTPQEFLQRMAKP